MYPEIFEHLPYKSSFRFVDNITSLNTSGVTGDYTLRKDAFFYEDHFIDNHVTPGVIITEIMAQIGLVVLGIYLILEDRKTISPLEENKIFPLLTSTEVSFFKSVFPGEKVTVKSEKEYFRFGKLKCYVEMLDSTKDLVARGTFSGIIKNATKEKKLL